jgi:hypothetical protein
MCKDIIPAGAPYPSNLTAEMAILELAKLLCWKEWHLDPYQPEPPKWDELPDNDRQFYCSLTEAILGHETLVKIALRR